MMKVRLLTPLGTLEKSYSPGDIFETDDGSAVRLVLSGMAEPVDKKEFATKSRKIEKENERKREDEARIRAILEKEAIELELNELYEKVAEKEAELSGAILSDREKKELVEGLKNRETRTDGKTDK